MARHLSSRSVYFKLAFGNCPNSDSNALIITFCQNNKCYINALQTNRYVFLSAERHLQRHPGQGNKGRGESPEEKVTIKLPRKLAVRRLVPCGGRRDHRAGIHRRTTTCRRRRRCDDDDDDDDEDDDDGDDDDNDGGDGGGGSGDRSARLILVKY